MEHHEKFEQIVNWYKSMFNTDLKCEVNLRTLHILDQLQHYHQVNTKLKETELKLLEAQIKEYKNENSLFSMEFISRQMFTIPSVNIMLDTLAAVATELPIRNINNLNHLYTNMNDMVEELNYVQDERQSIKQQFQRVNETANELIQRRNHLQKVQTELFNNEHNENTTMEHKKSQIKDYFKPKQFEYEQQQTQGKSYLNSIGLPANTVFDTSQDISIAPNCRHENLVKLNTKLEQLKTNQWEPLKKQISSYFDLPTDINLVKAVIAEEKQHLEKLENDIQEKINFLEN